jgi:hypothetical protein
MSQRRHRGHLRRQYEVIAAGSPIVELLNLGPAVPHVYVPEPSLGKLSSTCPHTHVDGLPDQVFSPRSLYIHRAEFTPSYADGRIERVSSLAPCSADSTPTPPERSLMAGMPTR